MSAQAGSSASPTVPSAPFPLPTVLPDVPVFPPRPDDQVNVDMALLELLHHYLADSFPVTFTHGETREATMQYALRAPYLMFQVLAVSARHLSLVRPDQALQYHGLAIRLQTQALAIFDKNKADLAAETCDASQRAPVLVFSTLLGVHALCDTLSFREDDFSMTLARFIGYVKLHRGVYGVVAPYLHQIPPPEAEGLTAAGLVWHSPAGVGHECDDLLHRLDGVAATMEPTELDAAKKAIAHLQWVFDAGFPRLGDRGFMALSWPVTVDPSYTQLLQNGRPEALVILAYYLLLLHFLRDFWVVGDSVGETLLESLARYLGPSWSPWLETPFRLLRESGTSRNQTVGGKA